MTDGFMSLMDYITRNLIHAINPRIYLISSTVSLGSFTTEQTFLTAVVNYFAYVVYPMCFGLSLPVFMYALVLEREHKLKNIMQMHGLKEIHYWIVNFFTNIILYMIAASCYFYFAHSVFSLTIFAKGGSLLMWNILFGWGLSQIGLAIFLQNFVSSSRTAILLGYVFSLTLLNGATYSNMNLYQVPLKYPFHLNFVPQYTFNRLFYKMTVACNSNACYKSYSDLDQEGKNCLFYLYLVAGFYPLFDCFNQSKKKNRRFYRHQEVLLCKKASIKPSDGYRQKYNSIGYLFC